MKTLGQLREDEHKAVKDYKKKSKGLRRQGKKAAAKKIDHIRSEEVHHAQELSVLIRKRGSR